MSDHEHRDDRPHYHIAEWFEREDFREQVVEFADVIREEVRRFAREVGEDDPERFYAMIAGVLSYAGGTETLRMVHDGVCAGDVLPVQMLMAEMARYDEMKRQQKHKERDAKKAADQIVSDTFKNLRRNEEGDD